LLNPGFLAVLLRDLAADYQKAGDKALPYEMPFLCLPLALHRLTRSTLPKSTAKKIEPWWEENSYLRVGFVERVQGLVGPTREAMIIGGQASLIGFVDGRVTKGSRRLNRTYWQPSPEMQEIQKAIKFVGRWFGPHSSGDIFSIFGVRP
jgi:hypothetical protein